MADRTTNRDTLDTFFFIPHTHWEGAVFKTREEYLDMGLPNILRALRLLKRYPHYRFVLDQACYVQPFLERYPEERPTLQQFVDEGRLAIVGGTDVMADVNMPGGESFVRQVLYGKRFFRRALGVDVQVGWQLDIFGHHAQMPQLMKLGGFRSFWFFRGVENWDVPAEFQWQGLDGSRIAAFWLPEGYAVTYGSPHTLPEFTRFMQERYDSLARFARGPGRVGPAGADVCEPEEHVPPLDEAFNLQPDAPFNLRLSTPMDYEAFVAERSELPVVTGELNPIFQGAYSSRILLKQRTREIEQALLSAEKLGALLPLLGKPVADTELWAAWEPMLFNHTHDLMSGVMTDHVYTDTLQSYNFSRHLAHEQVEARLQQLSECIDTRGGGEGEGIGVMVMNPLSWARSDVAMVNVGFSDPGVMSVRVTDPDGKNVPCQLLDAQRDGSGALLQAKVAFIARNVPALGYALYRIHTQTTLAPAAVQAIEGAALENEHYRVEFDAHSGAITGLVDKDMGWDVLSAPGNVVVREPDHGDLWEPYHPLDGGSRIAMTTPHPPPAPGAEGVVVSTDQHAQAGQITAGPIVSTFTVAHPFGAAGQFQTVVRLYAGLRRIDIHTRLLNDESFVRYRALFPANLQAGQRTREIPFGASEQPDGIEFPAQNWMDYGDGEKGLAVLNRGLPGNNVAGHTLMLSLLRSSSIVAYGFGGGYEPGMTSDSGLELGQSFDFDYALLPHAGSWQDAGVHRAGLEFNTPLLARTTAPHAGALPARWGLLDDLPANVVVSALKPGLKGSVVLRLYEATGQPAHGVRVRFAMPILSAQETNLLEDAGTTLPVADGALQLDLRPFEIKTLSLRLRLQE